MRRPKSRGNHSGRPGSRKNTAHAAIVQKYIFWPPLKKPTSSASTASSFDTYDLIRLIQRESAGATHIRSSQLSNCSAKNTTKPRLNHGCNRRVIGPPPKTGVSAWNNHGV